MLEPAKTETLSIRGMSRSDIHRLLEDAIALNAEEFAVSGEHVTMRRAVEPGEAVIPPRRNEEDGDALQLVQRLELETLPLGSHPFHLLHDALEVLAKKCPHPARWILAEDRETVNAFFDIHGNGPVFGLIFLPFGDVYADKIVVVGGPTTLLLHATHGVVIDVGL